MKRIFFCLLLSAGMSGCASTLSGITGGAYSCKAPAGTTCNSVSGTYDNALQRNLPGQQDGNSTSRQSALPVNIHRRLAQAREVPLRERVDPPTLGAPLRSPAKTLRIWMAPGEDAEGVFHDQRYVYLTVDPGRWQVENALYRLRESYRPSPVDALATSSPSRETGPLPAPLPAPLVTSPGPDKQPTNHKPPLKVSPVEDSRPLADEKGQPRAGRTGTERPKVVVRPLPPSAIQGAR